MRREEWGTIRKLPSGRFQAQTPVIEGKKRLKGPHTFSTRGEARAWLIQMQIQFEHGQLELPKPQISLDQVYRQMSEQMEAANYSPSTIRTYKSSWSKYLEPDLGGKPIDEIDSKLVKAWDAGKIWESQHARRKAIQLLKRLLSFAADAGLTGDAPQIKVAVSSRKRRQNYVTATPEQLGLIREGMPPELRVTIDLAGWCALRYGEIAALRGGDIDLEAGTVRVNKSIKRGVGGELSEGAPKSRAGNRTVAVPPAALERIRQHLEWYRIGKEDLVVWQPGSDGKAWLKNKELHKRFDPVVKGLELEGLRFHDLRHTGLTLAGEAGATLAELMARAGHSDVGAAMVYQHASLERDRALAARLGG